MRLIRVPLVEHRIWIKECKETFSYESWKILPLIEPHQGNFKGYILGRRNTEISRRMIRSSEEMMNIKIRKHEGILNIIKGW